MPHPHKTTGSPIRSITFRSSLTREQLLEKVEQTIQDKPALNHCFVIERSKRLISVQHLNQSGEFLIKHDEVLSNNFVTIEYRTADFRIARVLKRELCLALELSEPNTEGLNEPASFGSLAEFLQWVPKFFGDELLITASAVESARHCEFKDFEEIYPGLKVIIGISDHLAGRKTDIKHTLELMAQHQNDSESTRVILHQNQRYFLNQYVKIRSTYENQTIRLYYQWSKRLRKCLIGWVEYAPQS